ncbi:class I SAM-dependent methyltransferase [Nocardia sp. CC227C]|uniref:class I SAM-dependent methyltransferase n=1 Tax=Nocardia sp. CC227C TaxID=3044562 RepID=UPI00278C31C6|nr:class I SAM-dependent methyltransferase [Nocardia sp. CC227C]
MNAQGTTGHDDVDRTARDTPGDGATANETAADTTTADTAAADTTAAYEKSRQWRGGSGHAWADLQEALDTALRPFEELLVTAVRAAGGHRVLDIGCGAGTTTLAAARSLGADGRSVGVDISEPLIAVARERARRTRLPAEFLLADAQTYAFTPDFDTLISRFGVMFFADPVAAFANLRGAAREGAALRFVAWRGIEENPFMTTAERAAAPLVPGLPGRDPSGPGQFAFADRDRVAGVLADSGWSDITIDPVDPVCTLPEEHLVAYFTRLGPLGTVFADLPEQLRPRVVDVVRSAFEPYVDGGMVRYPAACWLVGARA